MDYRDLITSNPSWRAGKPCIRNLRMTVYAVLDYVASGMSEAEILAAFPDLCGEDVRACVAFEADQTRRVAEVVDA